MDKNKEKIIDLYLRKNFIKPPLSIFSKIIRESAEYNYDFKVLEKLDSEFQNFEIYKVSVKEYYLSCQTQPVDGSSYGHFALNDSECVYLQEENGLENLVKKASGVDGLSAAFLADLIFHSQLYSSHIIVNDCSELEDLAGFDYEMNKLDVNKEQEAKVVEHVKPPYFVSKNKVRFYTLYNSNSILEMTGDFKQDLSVEVLNQTLVSNIFI